jgi:hypothetical protein
MATQWHPVFARLLGLLIEEYYEIQTEAPVSDLPRRGDFLVLRRHGGPSPPFKGLWMYLTELNVLEYKGPSDEAEEQDLEKLAHVGTGLTFKINEERRARGEAALSNREVSFFYLAPTLGPTFMVGARARGHWEIEGLGLQAGRCWGHPTYLVAYHELPVEEDSVPLRLLEKETPRALAELVMGREDLRARFVSWLRTLHPDLWLEVRDMAATKGVIDWEKLSKYEDLAEVISFLPPERVIERLGVARAVQTLGLARVINEVGLARVINEVGLPRVISEVGLAQVISTVGIERVFDELKAQMPPEKWREMITREAAKEGGQP